MSAFYDVHVVLFFSARGYKTKRRHSCRWPLWEIRHKNIKLSQRRVWLFHCYGIKEETLPLARVGVAVGSRCDHAVCCLSSGQGSAGQAAGAEGQRDPAEDLQRDDGLGRAGHAGQTLSALTAAVSHLLISVSACLPACMHGSTHCCLIWILLSFC